MTRRAQATTICVTVASSVLSRYALLLLVTIVAAFGSMVTAYDEYLDTTRKIERYNRAIAKINNLLTWWESLGSIDKVARSSVAHLINEGEEVISEERLAWSSTSSKSGKNDSQLDAEGGGRGAKVAPSDGHE